MSIKNLAQTASPGTVVLSLNSTVPDGYLRMEGQVLYKADYPDLYAALKYSSGQYVSVAIIEGTTYFILPNPKENGDFLRQAPSGTAAGTRLNSAIRNIKGQANARDVYAATGRSYPFYSVGSSTYNAYSTRDSNAWYVGFDSSRGENPTANEFRPYNIAVYYYIKY
jgi:hypothetical protein